MVVGQNGLGALGGEATAESSLSGDLPQKVLDLRSWIRINPRGRSWVGCMGLGPSIPNGVADKASSEWSRIAKHCIGGHLSQRALDRRGQGDLGPYGKSG
jgi:hypothetical protein